jgi:hypothetical protein
MLVWRNIWVAFVQPLLQWKGNKYYIFWVCVCVALVIQCACAILWSVAFPAVPHFSTLSHKRHDLRKIKSYWTQNVCFDFLYNLVWNTYFSKKNCARYHQKSTLVFMQSTRYSCQISIKNKFSRQIFENSPKCQISWKPLQWKPTVMYKYIKYTTLSQATVTKIYVTSYLTATCFGSFYGAIFRLSF